MRLTDKELSEFADYIPPSKYDMEGTVSALADECSRLRELVKEMADKLEECHTTLGDCDFCALCTLNDTCPKDEDDDEDNPFECPRLNEIWSLVARARETIGGAK